MIKKSLLSMLVLIFTLAACTPAASTPDAMMEKPTAEMMEEPTDAMMEETSVMPETAASAEVVASGEAMMEESPTMMADGAAAPDEMMADSTATPDGMIPETAAGMMEETATPDAMMAGDNMMEAPDWFGVTLTDVRTGEEFTINDFKGKVVLVEAMAMWCPNCKQQQAQVKALHEALGMEDDLVSISLDVDLNEQAADLKDYTDANSFDWVYAVAPADVVREIGMLYGEQFLNPSSTPILIVDREGVAHPMPFGIKSAEDLQEFIAPFLSGGM